MSRKSSFPGIVIPFLLLVVVVAGWSVWWWHLSREVRSQISAAVAASGESGIGVSHGEVSISGWPFRVRVESPEVRVRAASGHAIHAPRLIAEAMAYNPAHWVVLAPEGLTLTRADKGDVTISAQRIRASATHLDRPIPNLALELVEPVFTPAQGAEVFPLARAARVEIETRPVRSADARILLGEAGLRLRLLDGEGRPGGPVESFAQNDRLSVVIETRVSGIDHLSGPLGPLRGWAAAEGALLDLAGEMRAGEARAELSSERLSVRDDGRLEGRVRFQASNASPALNGLARAEGIDTGAATGAAAAARLNEAIGGDVTLILDFTGGRTRLGPLNIAPAPALWRSAAGDDPSP